MIPEPIFIGVILALFVILFAATPDARITRIVKALADPRRWISWWHPEHNITFMIHDIGTWSHKTFVDSGGRGAAVHLRSEANEVLEVMDALMVYRANIQAGDTPVHAQHFLDELGLELADIAIFAFCIAYVQELDLAAYILRKHGINTRRKWSPPDENGIQHHVEPDAPSEPLGNAVLKSRLARNLAERNLSVEKLDAIAAQPDPVMERVIGDYIAEQDNE